MYSRALSSRSYVNLKNGQLPYQTQAEPTVNKNKSIRSKSVKHRQSLKNPVGRVLSEPGNATSPLLTSSTPNFACGHGQMTTQAVPQPIPLSQIQPPPIIATTNSNGTVVVPQMSTIVSTKSSVSNKTSSDHNQNDIANCKTKKFEVLNEEIIMKIEQAFIRLMRREKLFNVQLVAIFYLNYGEVEAWCLVHNKSNENNRDTGSSMETPNDDCDDEESIDELRNFELTQRIQAILRQYYNKTYQYVILYRDEDLSEYYRCIGIDRRRLKSEKQSSANNFNNSCLHWRKNQIWKNFKKSLHLS